jgi:hypothetical protein
MMTKYDLFAAPLAHAEALGAKVPSRWDTPVTAEFTDSDLGASVVLSYAGAHVHYIGGKAHLTVWPGNDMKPRNGFAPEFAMWVDHDCTPQGWRKLTATLDDMQHHFNAMLSVMGAV